MMRGVPIEVEDPINLLENINKFPYASYTIDALENQNDEILTTDKKQLRESAFLVEDALDEYMIYEERQPPDPGCAALFCEVVDIIKTKFLRHQIKCKYKELESQFHVFCRKYHVEQGQLHSYAQRLIMKNPQRAPLYSDEADIVGIEDPSDKLIDLLLAKKENLTVVCVVGMTGLGKTTLAKKVFDNKEVMSRNFECRVWITMSPTYDIERLLRAMVQELYKQKGRNPPTEISQMPWERLADVVKNLLHQKRYVVCFDDLWDTDFRDIIKFAFPNNMNGSRILITTRNMDVALYFDLSSHVEIHEMQPLTLEKSLELFTKKAFFDLGQKYCPENLIDICLEIVKKCKGIPEAIEAIGVYVSKKETNEWYKFSKNLDSEMMQISKLSIITEIFCFDYNNLPSYLQQCMLYFAIYPKNYEIKSKRLVRHWIAEGFIKQTLSEGLEEVAEKYLNALMNKCLVQKSSVSIHGKLKGVRIHDLFLATLRKKARDCSFSKFVIGHDQSGQGIEHEIIRRLSIATTSNDLIKSTESSHVRSLLFFAEEELPESLVKGIPTKYKLLKLLDFENARLLDVPENLGDLIHLKYLSFRNTDIRSIPKSIGKLQNLETLDLRQTNVTELPKETSKLRKLRHLLGNKMSLIQLKGGIGGMESLQTLSVVIIDEDGIELITELGKLTQLKKLSLFDVREGQGIALCSSINEMKHLKNLYIEAKSKDAAIDLSIVSNSYMLQKLRLKAKLNKLPEWIPKLEYLVELSMSNSQLTEDPLESLQDLPNLLVLNLLVRSYDGESLHFQGGFRYLKKLGLRYLSNVETIIIDQGSLPYLKELTFMNIPNLKMAPSGIQYLQNLEVLNTYFMPTEFDESIAPLAIHVKDTNLEYKKKKNMKGKGIMA